MTSISDVSVSNDGARAGLRSWPIEVWAFVAFAVTVCALLIVLLLPWSEDLRERILPVTGWLGLSPVYFAALVVLLGGEESARRRRLRVIALLGVAAVFGTIEYSFLDGAHPDANPYQAVSPWRPVWAVGVPLAWMLVFCTPRVARSFSSTEAPIGSRAQPR